ncbi:MAG: ketoacyl-ACP synthase III [Negativicutes bacterium]|nr:ketoacyl-ACP synthase III [Negativicutes bacterium]
MNCAISKISYYLPEKTINNQDFATIFKKWDADQIEKKVGITQRHIAAENETALDMAVKAAEKLFESYNRKKVDFILFCTQSPDYRLPTSACIIQEQLKLRKNIGALDFNLGCSGYIYGLSLAKGLIATGAAQTVLLLTAETYSKYMHMDDKVNRTIFGDAATATIIEISDSGSIGEFVFGTDGTGFDKLIIRNGGARNPIITWEDPGAWLYMDGPEIFNFTIATVPSMFKEVVRRNGEIVESLDYVIFHQANALMLNFLRKASEIPKEKFYLNMRETGNTVSNTIPIALANCVKQSHVMSGNKVVLLGFGVGLSWAGTVIEIK